MNPLKLPFNLNPLTNPVAFGVGFGVLKTIGLITRTMRKIDFEKKVVMITSGSRGLGPVLARQFSEEGALVVLISKEESHLERVKDELLKDKVSVETFAGDVSNEKDASRIVAAVIEKLGRIDILVNNAEMIEVGPVASMTIDDFKEAMQVHFWGPLIMTLQVIPGMKSRKMGRIINISSIGGRVAVPHLVPYTASKFALAGVSEGLRNELIKDSIFVTTVCP